MRFDIHARLHESDFVIINKCYYTCVRFDEKPLSAGSVRLLHHTAVLGITCLLSSSETKSAAPSEPTHHTSFDLCMNRSFLICIPHEWKKGNYTGALKSIFLS